MEATRQKSLESDAYFVSSGRARNALRQRGVPTVDIHTVRTAQQKRRFGRYETVEHVTSEGRGWLVGEHYWSFSRYGPYGTHDWVKEKQLTVLLDSDDASTKFARVEPDIRRGGYLLLGYDMIQDQSLDSVGAEVRRLTD